MSRKHHGQGQKRSQIPKSASKIPVTSKVCQVLQKHLKDCQNPGLVYERYVDYKREVTQNLQNPPRNLPSWIEVSKKRDKITVKHYLTEQERDELLNLSSNTSYRKVIQELFERSQYLDWITDKKGHLKRVKQSSDKLCQNKSEYWDNFQQRWGSTVKQFGAEPFPLKTDWRFVTGLGRGGPLEVGFTFHRIYGFPIIPGSGLKGLTRIWALVDLADRLQVKQLSSLSWFDVPDETEFEQKLINHPSQPDEGTQKLIRRFRRIFGTTKQAGEAVFFDAIPAQLPTLELDVMTPHFSKYYQDKSKIPPADWLEPSPVLFLTVGRNSEFSFAIGWRGERDEGAHQQAKDWLEEGLRELGAGAKTAAGYGYFRSDGIKEA